MSYIKFEKTHLINLEYSLPKEIIRTNRAGAYACQTLAGCNTRKYHALLACPQPGIDDDNHVLLSNLDETIIQHDADFNLGIHRYSGGYYNPRGHKYIRSFSIEQIPITTFRIGGVIFTREMLFSTKDDRVLIRYTLKEAHSKTVLRLRPYLAFRNVHFLTHANDKANKNFEEVSNGISMKLYEGYTPLFMQFSKQVTYRHAPDWYYNIEYSKEIERGYEATEDLLVPGYFEMPIEVGESIVFSAGTTATDTNKLSDFFEEEKAKRVPRDSYLHCLVNAAHQFIKRLPNKQVLVIAGFPYYGSLSRETLLSLPGIALSFDDPKERVKGIIETLIQSLKNGLFPTRVDSRTPVYQYADIPLWLFWSIQQLQPVLGTKIEIWSLYGEVMKHILNAFEQGTLNGIKASENGLIKAGENGIPATWMDATINGRGVTHRNGFAVDVNALWYNAVMFACELASTAGDKEFVEHWLDKTAQIKNSFYKLFWSESKGYLADYFDETTIDWSVRPNMIFAASMPYSPLSEEDRKSVISTVKRELLTPRGLRTLTPRHSSYKGAYFGNWQQRDEALHNGTVFPWLLGHFADAYLQIHGRGGLHFIKTLFSGFEEELTQHGIGSISEMYDGDPPHKAAGSISHSVSVAELIRLSVLIEQFNKQVI